MKVWAKTLFRGVVLWLLLLVPRIAGEIRFFWMLLRGDAAAAKRALRGMDMSANASALAGNPFETISSHCGRVETTWWARGVIWITDRVDQPGHCVGSNLQEQLLLDLIEAHRAQKK